MSDLQSEQSDFLPEIRVGKIGVLKVHQISDEELTMLVEGAPQSLYLNFAIALLSIATSFLISLLTTTITSDRVFIVFIVITLVGFISGLILLLLWWKTRRLISNLADTIRKRMPPEGEAQPLTKP